MSFIMSDANGFVSDLASATSLLDFNAWLQKSGTIETELYLQDGLCQNPSDLAIEIEEYLNSNPPKSKEIKEITELFVSAAKRCKGWLIVEQ